MGAAVTQLPGMGIAEQDGVACDFVEKIRHLGMLCLDGGDARGQDTQMKRDFSRQWHIDGHSRLPDDAISVCV
jgi:hypothetical protein